jgi:Nuclease-related domain
VIPVTSVDHIFRPAVEIAERLGSLPSQWRVVSAVPAGEQGGGPDHLVVGPSGAFAITTKHLPDAAVRVRGELFGVNGRYQHFIRHSRFETARVAALLSAATGFTVEVDAVIAVTGAQRGFSVRQQPRDVTVVNRRTITGYLHSRPLVLHPAAIEQIHEAARSAATWRSRVAC